MHILRKKRTFRFKFHSSFEIRNEWAKIRTAKCGPVGDANYLKVSLTPVLWLHACFELSTTSNLACVASVSSRVRRESWNESKKKEKEWKTLATQATSNSNAPPVILPLLDVVWNLPKHSNILEILAYHFRLDDRSCVSNILCRATLKKLKYSRNILYFLRFSYMNNSFSCKSWLILMI